jgi:hypothetical protein
MDQETPRRRRRLSAEDKWQIFTMAYANSHLASRTATC